MAVNVVSFVCVIATIIFSTASRDPNVLFIVIDDLRPALGCYGDKGAHTPNIDSLAERSILFRNAYAQQALCAPSRNSILTSRRPDTLHLYDFYNYWRDSAGNFTTLPQYFKEHGYYASTFGKVFHPGTEPLIAYTTETTTYITSRNGFSKKQYFLLRIGISSNWSDDQPYSWSQKPFHPSSQKYMNAAVCRGPDGHLHKNIVCPVEVEFQPGETLPDLETLSAVSHFLHDARNYSKQPFFLAVGFHKPHVPLKFPKEFIDFHPLESIKIPKARWYPPLLPTIAWNPWTDLRKRDDVVALNISFPFGPMPGWSMAEHGEWSKFSNYEIAVRVPLILYVPGMTDFASNILYKYSDGLTELVDIFPTLVDLVNSSQTLPLCPEKSKKIRLCTEGISLVPLIHHMNNKENQVEVESLNWKKGVFSQYPRPGIFPTLHPNSDKPHLKDIKYMGYSLRTLRYRYTEWVSFNIYNFLPNWTHKIGIELYDHQLDPNENFNIATIKEMRDIIQQLSSQLHAGWKHSLPKSYIRHGNL